MTYGDFVSFEDGTMKYTDKVFNGFRIYGADETIKNESKRINMSGYFEAERINENRYAICDLFGTYLFLLDDEGNTKAEVSATKISYSDKYICYVNNLDIIALDMDGNEAAKIENFEGYANWVIPIEGSDLAIIQYSEKYFLWDIENNETNDISAVFSDLRNSSGSYANGFNVIYAWKTENGIYLSCWGGEYFVLRTDNEFVSVSETGVERDRLSAYLYKKGIVSHTHGDSTVVYDTDMNELFTNNSDEYILGVTVLDNEHLLTRLTDGTFVVLDTSGNVTFRSPATPSLTYYNPANGMYSVLTEENLTVFSDDGEPMYIINETDR